MNFPNYHPFFLLTPMERRYYLMWVTHYDVLEFLHVLQLRYMVLVLRYVVSELR